MSVRIEITDNLIEVDKDVVAFYSSQIPFATSLALNNTIKMVRKQIVNRTYPKAFEQKNKAFPGRVFRMEFSTKQRHVVALYDSLGREWIERQIQGGTKAPVKSARTVAVPKKPSAVRGASGRVLKRNKPSQMLTRKGFFVMTRGKVYLVAQRGKDGDLVVHYFLHRRTRIQKAFPFYTDARATTIKEFDKQFGRAMSRALR